MNNYESRARKRGQNLLIVEGKHEKYEFFWLIFKCFPEMNIDIDSIWIYETNIYMLYEDIVNEYQSGWAERGDDVDLPFVISKKKRLESICYKTDFTNVILVFDYERHDPGFSERKIRDMQKYFIDETDMGKLYINYPMIESYLHLKSLPDIDYANRKIPVSLQPGNEYKALVRNESVIEKLVNFPNRVMDLLEHHWGVQDRKQLMDCYDTVLNVSDLKTVDDELISAFDGIIEQSKIQTAKFQLKDWIKKMNYAQSGKNYWEYMREVFKQVIIHNICKANRILNEQYYIPADRYKESLEDMDMLLILDTQNDFSRDQGTGYIWVLNTSVLFVAEYNFSLIE